ncbi:ferredoxin-nitrite reductase [Oikeobacillus pervagus]|uniref:Ferredoxin-nitrite reductase n=1 Tax=Oikeobacillus pervagus TaxID=1325931 RepID=A0AAJ1WI70_9BACI|nr:nitrite/sulfite reductase [Oikeobacillus pervagus]MDQ0214033.1 ferredoxin-nitrite reductase [Oikeobacillus pervagus]
MAYEKIWANDPKLNKTELKKLEKDGLEVLKDIPYYAENGFSSIPKEEWDSFKWAGLYLQRPKKDGYFMMRVKVPTGILSFDQLVTLAQISKDYGRSIFDITTRQAIQFHWLTIENIPDIFHRLSHVGLSTTGACGDIPRNIIGNPLAGIDRDEVLDTRPIVKQVSDFFQNNEDFSNLPRKFKMSINANIYNAGNAEINDCAFIPAAKVIKGERKVGFHLKVGGGLSSAPKLAQLVDIFILPEQVLEVAKGVTTIFRDFGYREKRHRARLKFLVEDWGVEKFKDTLLKYTGPLEGAGEDLTNGWNAGYFYGVYPQKQAGLHYVGINIPLGRLHADDVLELARVAKLYGDGEVRTCGTQNIIIANVPTENIEALLNEKLFEKYPLKPPQFTGYAVSCTGTEFCNLALTETKERMKRIALFLDQELSIDVPVRMHMTGCPNSCGQRQIADLGLQGVLMRNKEKKMVQAFEIYVGGTLLNNGEINHKLKGKIAGEHLPNVLKQFLEYFRDTKQPKETFYEYVQRVGVESLQIELDRILGTTVTTA